MDNGGRVRAGSVMERVEVREPLRFGIILPAGERVRAWHADAIRQVLNIEHAQPAIIVRARGSKRTVSTRIATMASTLLPHSRLERLTNLPQELSAVPSIERAAGDISLEDIARVAVDFVLCFDEDVAWDRLTSAARFGLWRFRVRAATESRCAPLLELALEKIAAPGCSPVPLRSGCVSVVRHSWTATHDQAFREMARWPAQVCRDIRNDVAELLTETVQPITARVDRTRPAKTEILHRLLVPWHAARYLFDRLFVQQTWGIGVVPEPISRFLEAPDRPIQWLRGSSSPYRYLADPFCIDDPRSPDGFWLLCEEYDSRTIGHGRLVHAVVQSGSITQTFPLPEIDPGIHVAYPYLIQHEGEIFCIPETAEAGGIDLYRAAGSPRRWTKVRRLIDAFPGVDSTAFQHDGRWWMATCSADDGPYHSLFLFYADALIGPWHPHAANPVKCDVRSARPAGTPFLQDGRLYRPAQDCSLRYGGSVSINLVEKLTATQFRETVVAKVTPSAAGPFPHGLHTLSEAGGYTLVDGRREFFDPLKQIRKQVLRRMGRSPSDRHKVKADLLTDTLPVPAGYTPSSPKLATAPPAASK
ncbi:MAG TPA: hypothetical protein VGH38_37130 [Bryobacteraceae bacterium]